MRIGALCTANHTVDPRVKGKPSSLRHFLATESRLKLMNNAFCFTLKTLLDPNFMS